MLLSTVAAALAALVFPELVKTDPCTVNAWYKWFQKTGSNIQHLTSNVMKTCNYLHQVEYTINWFDMINPFNFNHSPVVM